MKIVLVTGMAEVIGLRKFIKLIPTKSVKTGDDERVEYTQFDDTSTPVIYVKKGIHTEESKHITEKIRLIECSPLTLEYQFLNSVIQVLSEPNNNTMKQELEDKSNKLLDLHLDPTHLVLFGNREVALLNPTDFIKFTDKQCPLKQRIVCIHPYRNKSFKYANKR